MVKRNLFNQKKENDFGDFPGEAECPPILNFTLGIPDQTVMLGFRTSYNGGGTFEIYRGYEPRRSTTFQNTTRGNSSILTEWLHFGTGMKRDFTFHLSEEDRVESAQGIFILDYRGLKDIQTEATQILPMLLQPVFTIYLNPRFKRNDSEIGKITFGSNNDGDCGHPNEWIQLVPSKFDSNWKMALKGITVGTVNFTNLEAAVIQVERDNIEVPPDVFRVILEKTHSRYKKFRFRRGLLQHMVPCEMRELGPLLNFTLGEAVISIPPQQYIQESGFFDGCALKITQGGRRSKIARLGRPFLRQYCTTFNYQGLIGFTEHRPDKPETVIPFSRDF